MRKTTISRVTAAESLDLDVLAVYSVSSTRDGRIRSISDYVNTRTGEIIPAEQLNIPVLKLAEKLPARAKALASLRPEVRQFAIFVLRFANQRRGITPGIDVLCQWYAELHDGRSQDVRRYISPLYKAEVLAGDALLSPLFQRTGGKARDHLGEDYRATCTYASLRAKSLPISTIRTRTGDARVVANELALLDAGLEADRLQWGWRNYRFTRAHWASKTIRVLPASSLEQREGYDGSGNATDSLAVL